MRINERQTIPCPRKGIIAWAASPINVILPDFETLKQRMNEIFRSSKQTSIGQNCAVGWAQDP